MCRVQYFRGSRRRRHRQKRIRKTLSVKCGAAFCATTCCRRNHWSRSYANGNAHLTDMRNEGSTQHTQDRTSHKLSIHDDGGGRTGQTLEVRFHTVPHLTDSCSVGSASMHKHNNSTPRAHITLPRVKQQKCNHHRVVLCASASQRQQNTHGQHYAHILRSRFAATAAAAKRKTSSPSSSSSLLL